MFIILKTDFFQLWFLFKSDLLISIVEKYIGISIINYFKPIKTTISSTLLIKGDVVNRTLPSLNEVSIEITVTVPLV